MSLKKQFTTTLFTLFLGLTLTLTLTACGGGGGGGGGGTQTNTNTNTNTTTDTSTNTTTDITTSGQYDLSRYLFHSNLLSSNGEISFTEKLYEKDTGDQIFLNLNRKFTSADGIFIEEFSDNSLFKTFKINSNNIEENVISANAIRNTNRFAKVGDVFQDADNTSTIGTNTLTQNSRCTLLKHLDSFNLASATGNFSLTNGVYSDVLKVECITSFVSGGVRSPHTTLRSYLAKGTGVIFSEGILFLGGDVYITEEY